MTIRSFKSKHVQWLYKVGTNRTVPKNLHGSLIKHLDHLAASHSIRDLQMIQGFHVIDLGRQLFACWITSNWRLVFRFEDGDAYDVYVEHFS